MLIFRFQKMLRKRVKPILQNKQSSRMKKQKNELISYTKTMIDDFIHWRKNVLENVLEIKMKLLCIFLFILTVSLITLNDH